MQIQEASAERRYDSQLRLDTLLNTRKETLSLYTQLATYRPFKPEENLQLALQEFCEALVDYTAVAHLQIYSYIDEGKERRNNVKEVSDSVYPQIFDTTQQILDFNEKYDCGDACNNLQSLDADLSLLGEILADRILYEDQVIAALQVSR